MAKTICDWSRKEIERKASKLRELTEDPCFYCRKCGRVANTKKALCKAKGFEFEEKSEECRLAYLR
jgi:MinD superfamily P-loop ATPase